MVNTIPWARIFIDGEDTGLTSPAMNIRLSAGAHRVRLVTSTGQSETVRVEIRAGETVRIVRRLDEAPAAPMTTYAPENPF